MPECKHVFVTGATGFLGSHLTFDLLEKGHRVTALARSGKTSSARERLEQVLREIAGNDASIAALINQLDVVEGDISQPGLGLDSGAQQKCAESVDETWHCAASLSFADEDREEIFRMNVQGTEHVLQFVEQTRTRRLQHVSTAYVAGRQPNVSLESTIDVGQVFRNAYEESKCRSELLIAEAHRRGNVRASVYRPSIVIGDSQTGRVTHFHGVYAFIRALWTALARVRRRSSGSDTVHFPLRVLGSTTGSLNFVPIDYVVKGMIAISSADTSIGETFHLTNPEPTPNIVWLPHICQMLNVSGIELVDESRFAAAPMTKMEMLFQKQMAFYYYYLQGDPRFDLTQTAHALAGTGIACPLVNSAFIDKMAGWYINYLNGRL